MCTVDFGRCNPLFMFRTPLCLRHCDNTQTYEIRIFFSLSLAINAGFTLSHCVTCFSGSWLCSINQSRLRCVLCSFFCQLVHRICSETGVVSPVPWAHSVTCFQGGRQQHYDDHFSPKTEHNVQKVCVDVKICPKIHLAIKRREKKSTHYSIWVKKKKKAHHLVSGESLARHQKDIVQKHSHRADHMYTE